MASFNFGPNPSLLVSAPVSFSSANDNTIVAAGAANQIIRVFRIWFVVATATNITFKSGASTALSGVATLGANGALVFDHAGEPWFTTAAGQAFVINSSAAVVVGGTVYFTLGV